MLKIENIIIKNFKFHEELKIELNEKSTLIYGENGSGKSSIYLALYSIFFKYLKNKDFLSDNSFKNRRLIDRDTNIEINFNSHKRISLKNFEPIQTNIIGTDEINVFLFNREILSKITDTNNLYDFFSIYLNDYFNSLNKFSIEYNEFFNAKVTSSNLIEWNNVRADLDERFKLHLKVISDEANNILKNKFIESFEIKLDLEKSSSLEMNLDIEKTLPQVKLEIENIRDIKDHYNEAKIKLTSIAIFFALINLNTVENSNLNLIVLDDFLTSLDMSNRGYIANYLLEKYEKFQIIILTHNLQFYNLLEYLVEKTDQNWSKQGIYKYIDNGTMKSNTYIKYDSHIEELERKISKITNYGEYKIIGNLIRKEFERILHEYEKEKHLGSKEKISNIICDITMDKPTYKDTHMIIKDMLTCADSVEMNSLLSKRTLHTKHLKSIIRNLDLYRKTVMNPGSHYDCQSDSYHKEYAHSIVLLKELNKELVKVQN